MARLALVPAPAADDGVRAGVGAPAATASDSRTTVPEGVAALPGEGLAARSSDAELVHRARSGDGWAHEVIYRRYVGLVGNVAGRLLRSSDDVDDVIQDTFLIAFEQLDRLVEPAALRGWLVRIAVSRVHRRFRWRRLSRLWSPGGGEIAPALEDQASHDASPAQRAELALIDRALERLPTQQRTPWVLRHVVGCALEDIALACECSLATIKRRISSAEAVISAHLGEDAS
ncbi:MAG: RNA polymerase sigma factor [Kofleriaceae bacterium]|jgi:RNA polymerase sigma-70 factor (ECF subfamily)|nr:RNA polymerase sigma factor [Kofleriaceae bacterium]MBP6839839.1 RNA polymerase sigma factor [Kofleriaceae bacterium]MBP9207376.1 RNA polymerase sigma factor [Kofleriaceae bacterium]